VAIWRAERLSRQGLALAREIGDRVGTYNSLYNLASESARARERGDHAGAVRLYGQALVLPVEMGEWGNTTYCLEQLASITADEGYPGTGCEVIGCRGGAARRQRLRSGLLPHAQPRCTWGAQLRCTRAWLGEQGFGEGWARGRAMTPERAVAYTLSESDTPERSGR
jgi:hypothetical protein